MNTQLTDNEALELKALIAPSYPELEKIEDLEKVKEYLLNFKISGSLKILYLTNRIDIITLPETIGKLTQLDYLILDDCKNLQTLPDSIGQLENLKVLSLNRCINIRFLPKNIGELKENLKILSLRACEKLETLPESICNLKALTGLNLIRCTNINKLPDNIKELKNLKGLYLNNCNRIKEIPEDILELNNLENLGLCNGDNIENILDKIDRLKDLKELKLWNCRKIKKLPDCIVNLEKLTQLDLSKCKNLTTLPKNIGKLTNLTELNLVGCKKIKQLPSSIDELKDRLDNQSLLSIAFIYYRNKKYTKAKNYFLKIKIKENKNPFSQDENKCYFYAQLFLSLIYCQNKEWGKVQQCILEVRKSTNENHIKEVMDRINSIDNDYKALLLKILLFYLEIREQLAVNVMGVLHGAGAYYENNVAHYARPIIIMDILKRNKKGISKRKTLQMGSVAQVNDPSEGKVIFDYLNGLEEFKNNNIIFEPISELATFVGCFTFNHDKLNHFRLYGKEQGKEATGVSVVFNYQFFNVREHTNNMGTEDEKSTGNIWKKQETNNKLTLYRCIYLNPKGELDNKPYIQVACRDKVTFYREKYRTHEHWEEYKEDIDDIQENITYKFEDIKKSIKSLFEIKDINAEEKKQLIKTVSFILTPLSYMVKHSAYEEEQECRVFKSLPFDDKKIKIENKNDRQRMYFKYEIPVIDYLEKMYLSPGAKQYADMFRVLTNNKVEVRSSDNPFR
ncbi:MAG: hypothetical protein IJ187_07125 [Neisseriaceae bacterium]|nr:hypothetical protein [Neisseriaceae bacterium]